MCNLYSVTKGQQAIREAFRAMVDRTGNLPTLPGVFPDSRRDARLIYLALKKLQTSEAPADQAGKAINRIPAPPKPLTEKSRLSGYPNISETPSPPPP